MADQDEENKKQQPAVVINTAQPAPNYGGMYNAAFANPSNNVQGPTQPVPTEQSANQANPQDLNALQQKLASQQQAQQQLVPDKNINLGLNQQGQGGMQNAGYNGAPPNEDYQKYVDSVKAQIDAMHQQAASARDSASILGQQGLEENKQYQESAQKASDLTTDFNQKYKEHQNELQNVLKDYNDGHINPNQLHENMSVPQKIASAIGMLIAGAGAGLLHQENPVMKWMNQQIDRDIESQKSNINSAYNHYNQQMQNDQHAEMMTRALLQQNYANQIRSTAAKYAGPLAQQQAAGLAAQMEILAQKLVGELAMNQANMKAQQGLTAAAQSGQISPEQQAVMLHQAGKIPSEAFPKVMQEIKDAQDAARNEPAIMQAWERGREQFKAGGLRSAPGNDEFMNLFEPVIRDIDGRVNETNIKLAKELQSGAWNFPSTDTTHKQTVQQMISRKKAAPYAAGFGIVMPKQTSFNPYGK